MNKQEFKRKIIISLILIVIGLLLMRFSENIFSGINAFTFGGLGFLGVCIGVYLFFKNIWHRIYR